MRHKFVMELTDDVKGYEKDIERLEREYGIEPIEEHDKQIRTKIFNDIMPILIDIVDKEGCCYGHEQEIDRLECEWKQLKE